MKKCTKCGIDKPTTEFNKDNGRRDGLYLWCKTCTRANSRKLYWANPEKGRRNTLRWQHENKDKVKAWSRVRFTTPHGRFMMYKHQAVTRGLEFLLTKDDFVSMWQKPCFYCGSGIETIGLDRVVNSVGYILSNIVPCCEQCNKMKLAMSQKDFIETCTRISEKHKHVTL